MSKYKVKLTCITQLISLILLACQATDKNQVTQVNIPIYFTEHDVEIRSIGKLYDTVLFEKSNKEKFRFVFFDKLGKCYSERYVNGKLFQKGYYENSLDTLKRYVSSRNLNGPGSKIIVQKYFEPLKNGSWVTYGVTKTDSALYSSGILLQ